MDAIFNNCGFIDPWGEPAQHLGSDEYGTIHGKFAKRPGTTSNIYNFEFGNGLGGETDLSQMTFIVFAGNSPLTCGDFNDLGNVRFIANSRPNNFNEYTDEAVIQLNNSDFYDPPYTTPYFMCDGVPIINCNDCPNESQCIEADPIDDDVFGGSLVSVSHYDFPIFWIKQTCSYSSFLDRYSFGSSIVSYNTDYQYSQYTYPETFDGYHFIHDYKFGCMREEANNYDENACIQTTNPYHNCIDENGEVINLVDCSGAVLGNNVIDCHGVCGGDNFIDECGVCSCPQDILDGGIGDCGDNQHAPNSDDQGCGCFALPPTHPLYLNQDADNMVIEVQEDGRRIYNKNPNQLMGVTVNEISPKRFCPQHGTPTPNSDSDNDGVVDLPKLITTTYTGLQYNEQGIELIEGTTGPYNPDNWVFCGAIDQDYDGNPDFNLSTFGRCFEDPEDELGSSVAGILYGCTDSNAIPCSPTDQYLELDRLTFEEEPNGCYNPFAVIDTSCIYNEDANKVIFRVDFSTFLPYSDSIYNTDDFDYYVVINNVEEIKMNRVDGMSTSPYINQNIFYQATTNEFYEDGELINYKYQIKDNNNNIITDNINRTIRVERNKPTYIDYNDVDYFYNYRGEFESSIVPIIKIITEENELITVDNRYGIFNESLNQITDSFDYDDLNPLDDFAKQTYQLIFETDVSILDIKNPNTNFILEPAFKPFDRTHIKEEFTNHIWEIMGNDYLDFIPFNLIIDDEYRGLYLLKEPVGSVMMCDCSSDDTSEGPPCVPPLFELPEDMSEDDYNDPADWDCENQSEEGEDDYTESCQGATVTIGGESYDVVYFRNKGGGKLRVRIGEYDGGWDDIDHDFDIGDVAVLNIPNDFTPFDWDGSEFEKNPPPGSTQMSGTYYVCNSGDYDANDFNLCCHPDSPIEYIIGELDNDGEVEPITIPTLCSECVHDVSDSPFLVDKRFEYTPQRDDVDLLLSDLNNSIINNNIDNDSLIDFFLLQQISLNKNIESNNNFKITNNILTSGPFFDLENSYSLLGVDIFSNFAPPPTKWDGNLNNAITYLQYWDNDLGWPNIKDDASISLVNPTVDQNNPDNWNKTDMDDDGVQEATPGYATYGEESNFINLSGQTTNTIVISEISPSSEPEWIEIFNTGNCDVSDEWCLEDGSIDLKGWKFVGYNGHPDGTENGVGNEPEKWINFDLCYQGQGGWTGDAEYCNEDCILPPEKFLVLYESPSPCGADLDPNPIHCPDIYDNESLNYINYNANEPQFPKLQNQTFPQQVPDCYVMGFNDRYQDANILNICDFPQDCSHNNGAGDLIAIFSSTNPPNYEEVEDSDVVSESVVCPFYSINNNQDHDYRGWVIPSTYIYSIIFEEILFNQSLDNYSYFIENMMIRWNELRGEGNVLDLSVLIQKIDYYFGYLKDSSYFDNLRWREYGRKENYEEIIEKFKQFIINRITWIDHNLSRIRYHLVDHGGCFDENNKLLFEGDAYCNDSENTTNFNDNSNINDGNCNYIIDNDIIFELQTRYVNFPPVDRVVLQIVEYNGIKQITEYEMVNEDEDTWRYRLTTFNEGDVIKYRFVKYVPDVYGVITGPIEEDKIRTLNIVDENNIIRQHFFNDFIDVLEESILPIIKVDTINYNDYGDVNDSQNPIVDKFYCPGFIDPYTGEIEDDEFLLDWYCDYVGDTEYCVDGVYGYRFCQAIGDSDGINVDGYFNTKEECEEFCSIECTDGTNIFDEPKNTGYIEIIYNGEDTINNINDIPQTETRIGIEVRGFSHRGFAKKQYAIELQQGITPQCDNENANYSLFCNGFKPEEDVDYGDECIFNRENDFVILGPYRDRTFIRNSLAYDLWLQMGRDREYDGQIGIRTKHVEFILNGVYQGIFVFLENVKIDNDYRVTIPETILDDNDGGFILKVESGGQQDFIVADDGFTKIEYYDPNIEDFKEEVLKEDITLNEYDEKLTIIRRKINQFEREMVPGVNYDLDSFSDYWLMQEFARNNEGFTRSQYWYNKGSANGDTETPDKIYMGPVWDFNHSFGATIKNTEGWATQTFFAVPQVWSELVFGGISDFDPVNEAGSQLFRQTIFDRWHNLKRGALSIDNIFDYIDRISTYFLDFNIINRDHARWYLSENQNYESDINNFKKFILKRYTWMDGHICCGDENYTVEDTDGDGVVNCPLENTIIYSDPLFPVSLNETSDNDCYLKSQNNENYTRETAPYTSFIFIYSPINNQTFGVNDIKSLTFRWVTSNDINLYINGETVTDIDGIDWIPNLFLQFTIREKFTQQIVHEFDSTGESEEWIISDLQNISGEYEIIGTYTRTKSIDSGEVDTEGNTIFVTIEDNYTSNIITFSIEPISIVSGCTDILAVNYNPYAVEDDGSCRFLSDCNERYVEEQLETQNLRQVEVVKGYNIISYPYTLAASNLNFFEVLNESYLPNDGGGFENKDTILTVFEGETYSATYMVDELSDENDIGWQSTNSRGFDLQTTRAGMGFVLIVEKPGLIRWDIPEE